MKAYITGTGNISPQKTYDNESFLKEVIIQSGQRLNCIEPDYEKLIDPQNVEADEPDHADELVSRKDLP